MSSNPLRLAFTAIELLIVIGIMLILMGMAVPSIIPSLRRGALHNAANDIEACWRQARYLAMTTAVPTGASPPHFGIVIHQPAGARTYVAVIQDNVTSGILPRLLRQGEDPADISTYLAGNPAVAQRFFNRNVIVRSSPTPAGGTPDTAARIITIYAQYETGLPISPEDVSTGHGMVAAPTSMGVTSTASTLSSVCPDVILQTLDYVQGTRGYAIAIALYHAGFTSTTSMQE